MFSSVALQRSATGPWSRSGIRNAAIAGRSAFHTSIAAESKSPVAPPSNKRNVAFTFVYVRRLPAIQFGCSPRGDRLNWVRPLPGAIPPRIDGLGVSTICRAEGGDSNQDHGVIGGYRYAKPKAVTDETAPHGSYADSRNRTTKYGNRTTIW